MPELTLPPPLPTSAPVPTSSGSSQASPASTVQSRTVNPLLIAKGIGGTLELYPNFIRIKRNGLLAFSTHGIKGDKDIQVKSISAIQLKMPGLFLNGFIQFAFFGSQDTKSGFRGALRDENALMFRPGHKKEFWTFRDAVQRLQSGESFSTQMVSSVEPLTESWISKVERLLRWTQASKARQWTVILFAVGVVVSALTMPKEPSAPFHSVHSLNSASRQAEDDEVEKIIEKSRAQREASDREYQQTILLGELKQLYRTVSIGEDCSWFEDLLVSKYGFHKAAEGQIGTKLYSWSNGGQSISIMVQDGRVVQKSQFGIE